MAELNLWDCTRCKNEKREKERHKKGAAIKAGAKS
jgi:hypothetical protein